MVKRYGFGVFGEFTEQREGQFVLYRDYVYLEAAFARWKAETNKDVARIAELNASPPSGDSNAT